MGESVALEAPQGRTDLIVRTPDGRVLPVAQGRGGEVVFHDTQIPGTYVLSRKNDPGSKRLFVVRADPSESDLSLIDLEKVQSLVNTPGKRGSKSSLAKKQSDINPAPRSDLWPMVLMALFMLLVAEASLVFRSA